MQSVPLVTMGSVRMAAMALDLRRLALDPDLLSHTGASACLATHGTAGSSTRVPSTLVPTLNISAEHVMAVSCYAWSILAQSNTAAECRVTIVPCAGSVEH